LRKSIEDFNDSFTWEFKFLVNGQYWVEPLPGEAKQKVLSNDFWEETFDLTFNKIEPDENGNTLFQLDGFEWAREIILAGNFNNWNEHDLKMKKVAGGWEVRVDLPPGRYEYKFIADGNWLHDPANPDKVRNEHNTFNSVLQVQKRVAFRLPGFWDAKEVILAGSFNKWNEHDLKMKHQDDHWTLSLQLNGGKHEYKFIVDGQWMTDPANPLKQKDRHGNVNSVLIVR
jgi:1,4-alpha-glucan branching enzyme